MTINLNDQEIKILKDLLVSAIAQMDAIMQSKPSREVADASNALADIFDKLGSDD